MKNIYAARVLRVVSLLALIALAFEARLGGMDNYMWLFPVLASLFAFSYFMSYVLQEENDTHQ